MSLFKRVAIGISGGVDSAVSAFLLKSKGFDVHGVFMKNWDSINEMGICTSEKDFNDASTVCKKLDIPFVQVNYIKEYWNEIFLNMIKDYQLGLTPNPDILCNRNIKFKYFYNYCRETLKADAIATGHYANTSFGPYLENYKENENVRLLQALDKSKDQTFFLSQVPQLPLRRTMFPLANMLKVDVRTLAKEQGLLNVASKRDSTGLCFVGKRKWRKFISEYIEAKPGKFIDFDTGKVLGSHNGFHEWTLGQRARIGGLNKSYFILYKNETDNSIIVVSDTNHPALKKSLVITEPPNWINKEPDELQNDGVFECLFRYQHTKPFVRCSIIKTNNPGLTVRLETPLRSLTPGQYAIFYDDVECFGSARMYKNGPNMYFLGDELKLFNKVCL